jgi:hypothetical protein
MWDVHITGHGVVVPTANGYDLHKSPPQTRNFCRSDTRFFVACNIAQSSAGTVAVGGDRDALEERTNRSSEGLS